MSTTKIESTQTNLVRAIHYYNLMIGGHALREKVLELLTAIHPNAVTEFEFSYLEMGYDGSYSNRCIGGKITDYQGNLLDVSDMSIQKLSSDEETPFGTMSFAWGDKIYVCYNSAGMWQLEIFDKAECLAAGDTLSDYRTYYKCYDLYCFFEELLTPNIINKSN